ncbi:Hypp6562 [Branchiostoma lanceolatum]|uniref:Hypp6562 protein n=1 Tax=Branchiostoma lanceolatum TaxID=7740 RepID=A0A8K0E5A9_BRALA|nr:Hypp6562 [Branchiostoma lanceolatum]
MHNYPCDKSLAGVVENIAKGKLKSSAKLMMSHPILSSEILLQILSKLRMEVTAMMATANGPSLLRKTSPVDLQVFSYDEMEQS